ncbi:hypothetical protein [Bartonella grahamii]|uniref:hypothetical protein n=1 Tax=Bartonella grahamii TaxID=33045 RepID=UPI002E7B37F6|nr:hypothetical protein [Bartonella grahamii]
MKTITTDYLAFLTPKTFEKYHKTVDATIHTLEGKALPLITRKISKEYAKGNFSHVAFKTLIEHHPT